MGDIPNQYREDRVKSQGEAEVTNGSFLLMLFKFLKVPMPAKADEAAVERAGQLLTRKWPWLAKVTGADNAPP